MSARASGPGSAAEAAEGRAEERTVVSRHTWRRKLTAKVEESLLEGGGFKPIEGAASNEDEVESRGKSELMGAEAFAEPSLGAGASDGVADGGAGGDESRAGGRGGLLAGGFGLQGGGKGSTDGLRGAGGVIKHKGAAIIAAPLGADVVEIRRPTQVLVGAETHGARPGGGDEPRRRFRRR
jgi:hypothetical protein